MDEEYKGFSMRKLNVGIRKKGRSEREKRKQQQYDIKKNACYELIKCFYQKQQPCGNNLFIFNTVGFLFLFALKFKLFCVTIWAYSGPRSDFVPNLFLDIYSQFVRKHLILITLSNCLHFNMHLSAC